MTLKAPFPYFGGKRHVAPLAWRLLGDPACYVEPFAGSAAVLLGRPRFEGKRREIINDLDGWITNLWRAVRDKPEEVARYARGPIMELDNHARLAWLRWRGADPSFADWLAGHPENCDPKAAGWWLLATVASIGGGTRQGPWVHTGGGALQKAGPQDGISRSIPDLGHGRAVHDYDALLPRLGQRFARVTITQGDWRRALSKALETAYRGNVGVFLDPPYSIREEVDKTLYSQDSLHVSHDVREWCKDAPADWRIILCGYDDEHDELLTHGWLKAKPPRHMSAGYNMSGLNANRDQLWTSPACLDVHRQDVLDFGEAS